MDADQGQTDSPRAALRRFGTAWFGPGGALVLVGLGCVVAALNWLSITQGYARGGDAQDLALDALAGAVRWGLLGVVAILLGTTSTLLRLLRRRAT
ncbi:hypothetical protein IF650_00805 [Cellulosimicrobium terreum]|nr:hypothetical protein [Cellulosimicrobium terreum]